jgi:hypothetical protein
MRGMGLKSLFLAKTNCFGFIKYMIFEFIYIYPSLQTHITISSRKWADGEKSICSHVRVMVGFSPHCPWRADTSERTGFNWLVAPPFYSSLYFSYIVTILNVSHDLSTILVTEHIFITSQFLKGELYLRFV